jgi:hypothetical protein
MIRIFRLNFSKRRDLGAQDRRDPRIESAKVTAKQRTIDMFVGAKRSIENTPCSRSPSAWRSEPEADPEIVYAQNTREREFLMRRAAACLTQSEPPRS